MQFNDLNDEDGRLARYHCAICARPFDRRDTLSRHMQIHDKQRLPQKTRRKACASCSRSKTRCNGQHPTCSSCEKRRLHCIYVDPRQAQPRQQPSIDGAESQTSDRYAGILPQITAVDHLAQLDVTSPIAGNGLAEVVGQAHISYPDITHQSQVVAGALDQCFSARTTQPLMLSPFDNTDFTSNLDWFLNSPGELNPFAAPDFFGLPGLTDPQGLQSRLFSAPQTAAPSAGQSDVGDDPGDAVTRGNRIEDDANRSVPSLGGLLTPQPHETNNHDPWPMETPSPALSHVSIPMLVPNVQEPRRFRKFCSLMDVNERTWLALQKCIRLPFDYSTQQTLGLEHFPPRDTLDQCIDLYFTYFHPMLEVVHQPTFDPGKDLVVTLAIITIGACYTGFAEAKSFSIVLSELIRKLLIFMAEQDRRFVRTASYLTAQLLQGTHGYCSGSERLFEISESCRSTLVHHAKCMGLFRYETPPRTASRRSLDDNWRAWIVDEGLRRLGWAVYKYDASVAYLHNNRPFLSTGEINLNLPGSAEHWAAESAQAWAALHPWTETCLDTPRLRPMIRLLFDGTESPADKITDEEHRFLILLTLVRMLWTLKEIRSSPINDLATPPALDEGRQNLMLAIDQLAVPVSTFAKHHTRVELERQVHHMQLVHVSHIYGAGDLMNWLYPYLRHGPEAENATVIMNQWADESAARIRDVTYHCAQILGLIRQHPSNMPLEPFLIFHAGVVLSCMASLLPRTSSTSQAATVQLDQLDPGTGEVSKHQKAWVALGGDQNISLLGVPSLACADGRRQILDQTALLLKRQKVWGMAQNLTKVVLSLAARDVDKDMRDATGNLQPFSANLSPEGFRHGD